MLGCGSKQPHKPELEHVAVKQKMNEQVEVISKLLRCSVTRKWRLPVGAARLGECVCVCVCKNNERLYQQHHLQTFREVHVNPSFLRQA